MLIPSLCLPSEPLLSCDLARMHCNVKRGIGAQVMRVVDYAHFARLGNLSITIWYKVLPSIIFDYTFHTSLTNPILPRMSLTNTMCTLTSTMWNIHWLVKLLNIKSLYSLSHVLCDMYYFLSHKSYLTWPTNVIIESHFVSHTFITL